MRLVLATQTLDPRHGALAQTLDVVRALAARCDELAVVCQTSRTDDLPRNVEVRTFGARSRPVRVARFEAAVARELRRRPEALVAHMIPEYVVLAAPLAKLRRTPILLWYTHWNASLALRLATRLADAPLSVDRRSYPIDSPKVRGIGHAIDVDAFAADPPAPHDGPLRLLWLGRYAPWKGLATLLDALERAEELAATVELRGAELTDEERAHRRALETRVRRAPALASRVRFEAPVPRAEVPALLAAADALVSPIEPRAGATLDKVVYEAAACARPVVSSNPALDGFLDDLPLRLRVPPRDPAAVAGALSELAAAPPDVRAETGRELRRRVVAGHSLDSWADEVVRTARELHFRDG
jgi:glycosyltransferase involved in cell wall biosynthesis